MILSCFFSIKMLVFLFLFKGKRDNCTKMKKIRFFPISLIAEPSDFLDYQSIL
jgi:hypothetical protein